MSTQALFHVFKMRMEPSSLKFVMVAIADCANEKMECFPSIKYICGVTSQDRKTVLSNVKKLMELGYLSDTGERKGRTSQIKIYRLNIGLDNSPENGIVNDGYQNKQSRFSLKESRFSAKESQKRDTEPTTNLPLSSKKIKNDFERKLLSVGFLEKELRYLAVIEDALDGDVHIIRARNKWAADLLDQNCSYKLTDAFPKWRIEVIQ